MLAWFYIMERFLLCWSSTKMETEVLYFSLVNMSPSNWNLILCFAKSKHHFLKFYFSVMASLFQQLSPCDLVFPSPPLSQVACCPFLVWLHQIMKLTQFCYVQTRIRISALPSTAGLSRCGLSRCVAK